MDDLMIDEVEAEEELRRQEEADMELALQWSLEDSRRAGSSKTRTQVAGGKDLQSLDDEIEEVERKISSLQSLLKALQRERNEKIREIQQAEAPQAFGEEDRVTAGTVDYNGEFEWTGALHDKLKAVFGFNSFRSCQEGICNANLDGRDIVAIMPTGGGKSLGYQLPALIARGCTLVISPLLALISDQVMHLHENNVDAVMLTGATPTEEQNRIYKRLQDMANGTPGIPEIKLCYVTPEKIANSKKFKTALDKLFRVKKLARFVIDEAHCVSDHGHDFRPDYQKLNVLRQLYPKVPILALSATCPPAVLKDVLDTLRMPGLTRTATAAEPKKTVLFNTPLYRKNLHYAVHPKPAATNESIAAMRDYILVHHKGDTGIVYCLTKKDCEFVAQSLREMSAGAIKTGVYHADVQDADKEALHKQWREGKVKVVCATIAFGLGIDKGDVRFVIHHSLSKSLDGFYQESGRAGRDGKDADCILYYRPQDGMRISSLACDERHGQEKALAMMAFASDLVECRKIQFAKYFNKSSKLSLKSWEVGQEDAGTPCGHCDNCTRPPDTLERAGTRGRVAAWQVLRVAEDAREGLPLAKLCDRARGLGSATTTSVGKGKGRAREKATVDLERVAGGKVGLTKEHAEALCVRLLVEGYFAFSFQQNQYSVNVYLQPSATAGRFTRFGKDEIEQGKGPAFDCVFLKKPGRKTASGSGSASKVAGKTKGTRAGARTTTAPRAAAAGSSNGTRGKRKRESENETSIALGAADSEESEDDEEDDDLDGFLVKDSDPIEDDEDEDWHTSLRSDKGKGRASIAEPQAKRPRKSGTSSERSKPVSRTSRTVREEDVIDISSD